MATTSCYICGVPCNLWSSYNHNTCPKCAADVHEKENGIRNHESLYPDGDGFPINSSWEEHVQLAKKEWAKKNLDTCHCCGKSCKNFSEGGEYVSVCPSCNKKLRELKYGVSFVIENDGDGIPLVPAWNALLAKIKLENQNKTEKVIETMARINTWDLLEGDRVELRITDPSADDGEVYVEGTFLMRNNDGTAIIALDDEYHSDEYDSQDWYDQMIDGDQLKAIGDKYNTYKSTYNLWSVEDDSNCETKITKVLKHQVAKGVKGMPTDMNTGREMSWTQIIAKDSGKAAIRSGATLGIDGLKAGVKQMLTSQGMAGPGVTAVMEFFDTKIGDAALRAGLGYTLLGLPIPYIQENEYAQQISEECRVSGLSGGMDQVAAMVKMFIVPALMDAFKNTPIMKGIEESANNKARVAESIAPQRIAPPTVPHEEELEIEADPFKAPMRASA